MGERRPQLGDWECKGCGFHPNFARRRNCFDCRRPRSPRSGGTGGAGGGARGLSAGPIGAGGLRPLLGGRAAAVTATETPQINAQRAPSYRVPGASVAARASEAAEATAGRGGGAVTQAGTAPTARAAADTEGGRDGSTSTCGAGAEVDADGFQTVRGNAWRRRMAAAAKAASQGDERSQGAGLGKGGDARAGGEEVAGERATGNADAEDTPPSAEELHQAWLAEVAVVRRLRQQGLAADHPAMAAACSAREKAEALWRGAKDPAPPAVRLSRVQNKLDRAVAAQAESRSAIIELERAHKAKLAELQARLDEDTERVRLRRRQLEEVQDEIAQGGTSGRARARQGQAVQKVHATLASTIAPTISALVDQLESSTPAWSILNGLLGTLSSSQTLLEEAMASAPPAQTFDIGDGEGTGGGDGDGDDRDDDSDTDWSESHEMRDVHAGQGGQAEDQGGAQGSSWSESHGADQAMGAGEWWQLSRADWGAGVRWQECGHGKWSRTRSGWADSWEDERAGEDGGADQPAAARRRLGPAPQEPPNGANYGSDDVGDPTVYDVRRRQLHAERLQRITTAAIDAGIQPLTSSGEELQMLDSAQLDAWVAENLQSNAPTR